MGSLIQSIAVKQQLIELLKQVKPIERTCPEIVRNLFILRVAENAHWQWPDHNPKRHF